MVLNQLPITLSYPIKRFFVRSLRSGKILIRTFCTFKGSLINVILKYSYLN